MELILEPLLQFLGEIALQLIGELIAEFGFRSLSDTVRRPRHPMLSSIGFILWGAIAGGLSLLLFPHLTISDPTLRVVNLIATPLLIGLLMMMIGKLRERKGQKIVRLDRFGYAFLFALSMGVVRFFFAT